MGRRLLKKIAATFLAVCLGGCAAARSPNTLGVSDGRLSPCPSTPNCVTSQAIDEDHRISPFPFEGSTARAMDRMAAVVRSFPRTSVIEAGDTYLRAEFKSLVFRFVDDVEFLADPDKGVIHVRSASRVGRSDLGANRKRVEALRARWTGAGD